MKVDFAAAFCVIENDSIMFRDTKKIRLTYECNKIKSFEFIKRIV